MDFSAIIAEELKLETWRVAKALELMDQGGTIPFIARRTARKPSSRASRNRAS